MESSFKIEKEGNVAWLILNRPEKRNSMTWEFFAELGDSFRVFDEDPEVRAIVIRAEGKMFTAGLDLVAAGSLLGDGSAAYREGLRKKILEIQEGDQRRRTLPKAGHRRGARLLHRRRGGSARAPATSVWPRKDAIFSIRETRIGIVADLGTLQRLPTIIGHGWSRELALTGRDFTAEEALKMGFITRLCEDREALLARSEEACRGDRRSPAARRPGDEGRAPQRARPRRPAGA